jgi:hypothetical protein
MFLDFAIDNDATPSPPARGGSGEPVSPSCVKDFDREHWPTLTPRAYWEICGVAVESVGKAWFGSFAERMGEGDFGGWKPEKAAHCTGILPQIRTPPGPMGCG